MKFFILAGGYGKRAEPLSLIKPKALFPLAGIPLLRLLLKQLQDRHGLEGFINPHHLGDQIVKSVGADGGIDFIHEKELSGSMVLRQALPFFSDWLLVINGDTFLEIPLQALLQKTTDPAVDGVLLVRRDPSGRYVHLESRDDVFLDVSRQSPGPGLMYAGVALFKKRAVEKINDVNFFASISRHGLFFKIVAYDGIWLDIGSPGSYLRANWAYQEHVMAQRGNALSANVTISVQAQVEKSILWENTHLGDRVSLSECIVTGNVAFEEISQHRCVISRLGIFPIR
jgi:mannose-1-phosphate guanylyltransferase